MNFTFLNHASFLIETETSFLIVDPWYEGLAFNNGWSLLDRSTSNINVIEKLLKEPKKDIYIWYSHEHSDHFSISFLKELKKYDLNINILFQKTLDKRVVIFLRNFGYPVFECDNGFKFNIDNDLDIFTWSHTDGDSYCYIKYRLFNILNINDCIFDDHKKITKMKNTISKIHPKIDILMTQFGYANWISNETDKKLREDEAQEKLKRMKLQLDVLQPNYLIPFASYIYFCNKDNFFINDSQNCCATIRSSNILKNYQNKIVFMKPNQSLRVSSLDDFKLLKKSTKIAENHWDNLIQKSKILYHNEDTVVSLENLKKSFGNYRNKINVTFFFLPYLLELLGLLKPVIIHLNDHKTDIKISYLRGIRILEKKIQYHVCCSSSNLNFVFEKEFGFNTLSINGFFSLGNMPKSQSIFFRFFVFQNLLKNGFGIKHPFTSLHVFIKYLSIRFGNKWNYNQ